MKVSLKVLLSTLLFLSALSFAEGKKFTADQLKAIYTEYLTGEGYKLEYGEGSIKFKVEGGLYILYYNEKDAEFFNLAYPGFWSIENEKERSQVLVAADSATGKTKVAKVYTSNNNTWATIEMFIPDPSDFRFVFPRSITALKQAVKNFKEKMAEQTGK